MEDQHENRSDFPERQAVIAGAVILVALLVLGGGMMGPGMMLGGPVLLLGGGLLVVWLLRGGRLANVLSARNGASSDRSLDILRERYAQGEVSDDQYERMRNMLSETTPPDQ